ncbi:MAG: single-stranded-DNA-specific exonuclease RecJ [Firmicutes bacterium]|nr:single-stranded-DNA-specific exonuclease RecJ [Bacillota bacterium]
MKSALDARWVMRKTDANLSLMSEILNISEVMARVMANRDIRSKNTALSFLKPSIENLRPFSQMKDAQKALIRIGKALSAREQITVYGDYDADGITSTVILYKVLKRLGARVSYYIPHRVKEGYGLNKNAVTSLAYTGTNLIITVDSGISATEEVALAASFGIDTVIIDHHEQGDTLPQAIAVVDPKQHDCPYPFKGMCSGGLTYKLAVALCEYMKVPFVEQQECLVLAAIATICDIVPLRDENRILVNCGMILLNANKLINPGLGSLLTVRGFLEKPIDTFTVGFVIGPCINASGRLDHAAKAVDLFLAGEENVMERIQLTHELIELNDRRKQLTTDCVDRILSELPDELDKILVIRDDEIHESIAGIVAGRIKESTGRPTILLTRGDEAIKGSGRSSGCYNIFEALLAHSHLFVRFGGHAMAAGLTITEENIPLLREALNRDCALTEEDFRPQIDIDCELPLEHVTIHLADELSRLAPFGSGNHEPLFASRGVYVENMRAIDDKNTLIFTFKIAGGYRVKGIAFGLNDVFNHAIEEAGVNKYGGFCMDVVYGLETNVFNGNISVQMRVRDFAVLSENN